MPLARRFARSSITICAIVAGSLAATGCSGTQTPTFSVIDATVLDRTSEGVVLNFVIEADNPNSVALPLQDVEYTVYLNDNQVFSGTRSAEAILRRFGSQRFSLPAVYALAPDKPMPEGAAYSISGSVIYVAPGALAETLFDQSIIKPSASFSGKGTLK